jgi:uncharacterized protein YprB with RNaseH-like and TPR domain
MNLKEKLARLDKKPTVSSVPELTTNQTPEIWLEDFQREFDARIIRENTSTIIIKENIFSLKDNPYYRKIREADYIIRKFHHIFRDDWTNEINIRKILFIDLETTGLAGGTGTYAFLVGIGFIELDHIVVRQYILPDFQYEWLLLKHIENLFLGYDILASFNGKSYDIPLLRNRFVLNRMDSVLDDMKHMDILHAARRLWKRRLTSCDLGNLEYAILGMERISDIPGEMIPQIYFEYIRKRQALLLRDVLEHNYHDITNMILLTLFVAAAVNDPFNTLEAEEDLYSLAKYLYQNNHFDETNSILTKLNDQCENPMIKKELLFLLSMTHKKRGDLDTSRIYFQKLLETQRDHPGALEELAKYYEHHEKNFPAALELINQGLEYDSLMTQLGKNSSLSIIKDDLYFRRARLERKLSRANQATET